MKLKINKLPSRRSISRRWKSNSLWNNLKMSDLLVAATWAEEFGAARVARIAAAMVDDGGEVGRPDFDDLPLIIEALGLMAQHPGWTFHRGATSVAQRVDRESDWRGRPRISVASLRAKLVKDFHEDPWFYRYLAAKPVEVRQGDRKAAEVRAVIRLREAMFEAARHGPTARAALNDWTRRLDAAQASLGRTGPEDISKPS